MCVFTRIRKVSLPQLVVLDSESLHEDLLSLGSSDSYVTSNFFISFNTKRTNSESCFRGDGVLAIC